MKPKVNRKAIVNSILTPIELGELTGAMMDFLFKQRRKYTVVKRDRLSIKEKLAFMKKNLKLDQQTDLDTLLSQDGEADNIDNIVITFISLLELARLKHIAIFQNEDRGKVYVNVVKSLEELDVNNANGFEEEGEQEADELDAELEATINESMAMEEPPEVSTDAIEAKQEEMTETPQPEVTEKLQ